MAEQFNLNDLKPESTEEVVESADVVENVATEEVVEEGGVKEVNIADIRPYKEVKPVGQDFADKIFGELDAAVEREKEKITALQEEYMEAEYQKQLENGIDDEDAPSDEIPAPVEQNEDDEDSDSESVNLFSESESEDFLSDLDFDDDDDYDEEDEEANEENDKREKEEKEYIEKLKASVKETIVPVSNTVDLSTFTFNKKPVSISKLLSIDSNRTQVADWVLYNAKRPISISELSGPEIEKLDPQKSARNRLNTFKEIYNIIYKHVVDANKPDTLEKWVKTIKFFDLQHLYFAVYKACFSGNNSIPYNCPECKETFMADIPIENMIKYKSEEIKQEINNILQKDTTSEEEYPVTLRQISDDYAVAIKDPSVYNIVFETAALDDKFTQKYSDLLGFISYIDGIYYIDRANNTLSPVGVKQIADDIVKSTKNKVRVYYEVLSTLTSDQYYALTSYITNVRDGDDNISYIKPEAVCPKCGHTIPEEQTGADELLFTRHRLAAISIM